MPKLLENKDGSAVVVLDKPVTFKGEQYERVTVPALTGRHMRLITWAPDGSTPTGGQIADFAARVIVPAGVFDDLGPADALFVSNAVQVVLGKALSPTGESASPSSADTSAGPAQS